MTGAGRGTEGDREGVEGDRGGGIEGDRKPFDNTLQRLVME